MTGDGLVEVTPGYVLLLVGLVAVAVAAALVGRIGVDRAVVAASARAAAQLAIVSLLIAAVLRTWWATLAFVTVMVAVASITSARRVASREHGWTVLLPIAAGSLPVVGAVVAARTMPVATVTVLPIAGILVGGAMTATSLAGRRALDELRDRRGEHEAALALGLEPRDAALELVRPVAVQALVPALDQTRTVGLVTLPGAFVGVLLGGGSAVQAGATQLLVLVGLLAAQTVAVMITLELVARGVLRPRLPR